MENKSIKSEESIEHALGIFQSENIYLSPEFIEGIKESYGVHEKDMALVLKKDDEDGE